MKTEWAKILTELHGNENAVSLSLHLDLFRQKSLVILNCCQLCQHTEHRMKEIFEWLRMFWQNAFERWVTDEITFVVMWCRSRTADVTAAVSPFARLLFHEDQRPKIGCQKFHRLTSVLSYYFVTQLKRQGEETPPDSFHFFPPINLNSGADLASIKKLSLIIFFVLHSLVF